MGRLTVRSITDGKTYVADNSISHHSEGYSGDAIELLGRFEDFYYDLMADKENISLELEKLRDENKTKSLTFKELFTKKLINNNFLIRLKNYGFK